jgi:protein-disulfide isomerase
VLTVEPELIERFVRSGQVKLVFRSVLNHDERSLQASEAAACAGEQQRFWDMRELVFNEQDTIWATSEANLPNLMVQFGQRLANLDQEQYGACLSERRTRESLEQADAEQRQRGIRSQPIFEIGEVRLIGLQSVERLASVIEAAR